MIPQLKATELFLKFRMRQTGVQTENECKQQTINCCLILVNERLNELNFTHIGYGKDVIQGYQKTKIKYWQEVKNELEKM